jgi:hypothetical protein
VTLNTSIVIGKPYNVHEVYAYCRALLNTPEHVKAEYGPEPGEERSYRSGQKWVLNPGGIGLDAWLWIYYGADGPMVHQHDKWCDIEVGPAKWDDEGNHTVTQEMVDDHAEQIANDPTENGWGAIEVTFDTAYGYRSDSGEGCSQLHARLVAQLGKWLDQLALPWKWQNEYTGEWFDGYNGLSEFVGAHESTGAASWFNDVVMPAIQAGLIGG